MSQHMAPHSAKPLCAHAHRAYLQSSLTFILPWWSLIQCRRWRRARCVGTVQPGMRSIRGAEHGCPPLRYRPHVNRVCHLRLHRLVLLTFGLAQLDDLEHVAPRAVYQYGHHQYGSEPVRQEAEMKTPSSAPDATYAHTWQTRRRGGSGGRKHE